MDSTLRILVYFVDKTAKSWNSQEAPCSSPNAQSLLILPPVHRLDHPVEGEAQAQSSSVPLCHVLLALPDGEKNPNKSWQDEPMMLWKKECARVWTRERELACRSVDREW